MINRILICFYFFIIVLLTACQKQEIIIIRDIRINVEIADSAAERQKGLMFREHLPENSGMLFIFPEAQILTFWMKNTFIPLSIAFIDDRGYITQIEDMSPLDESNLHTSWKKVKYALEMNQDWFRKNHIAVGDRITGIK